MCRAAGLGVEWSAHLHAERQRRAHDSDSPPHRPDKGAPRLVARLSSASPVSPVAWGPSALSALVRSERAPTAAPPTRLLQVGADSDMDKEYVIRVRGATEPLTRGERDWCAPC